MLDRKVESYRLNTKIKDETFNVDALSVYNLSLQISPEIFRICITDLEKSRCLLLEDYELSPASSPQQIIDKVEEIYDNHHVLKAGFWKSIKLAIKTPKFSLVPNTLFQEEYAKDYLNLNCTINENIHEEIYYYKQNSIDVINIFSADRRLVEFFRKAYPGKSIQVIHHTSPLIESIILSQPHTDDRSIFLYVEKDLVTIIITRSRTLELCNIFNFTTPEDFVYYLMFVIEQLKLNPDKNPITIWGDILPDSDIYKLLYKYIRNISFGNKPSSLYFGYYFDELFDHSFYDLYSMHFCD